MTEDRLWTELGRGRIAQNYPQFIGGHIGFAPYVSKSCSLLIYKDLFEFYRKHRISYYYY